jgi:hypothetical protein
MNVTNIISRSLLVVTLAASSVVGADVPSTTNGVTTIHLDEYNGYFTAQETLVDLKPGDYEFIISNKAGKLVGFWLQDGKTHEFLDKFPLEPGQTRTARVTLTGNGFRYRCPINPTPWYEVGVSK